MLLKIKRCYKEKGVLQSDDCSPPVGTRHVKEELIHNCLVEVFFCILALCCQISKKKRKNNVSHFRFLLHLREKVDITFV